MHPSTVGGSTPEAPQSPSEDHRGEEPQRRERERSGILGEPAHIPPGSGEASDASERDDPIHEQVPQDGIDRWRR